MNIVFDLGMVLVNFRWYDYSVEMGIKEDVIQLLEKRMISDPIWDEFDKAIIPYDILIDKIEKRFPENVNEYRKFWQNPERICLPFDYSEKWLKDLKDRGHNIYILSNYPKFLLDAQIKNFTFMKYTDGSVFSHECHLMKPDHLIYQMLLKKFSLNPCETVFIDDRIVNINGACEVGINGILFESYEITSQKLEKLIKEKV